MALDVLNKPLARSILTRLRSKDTDQINFRKNMVRLGRLIGYEIADNLENVEVEVETPLAMAKGVAIKDLDNVIIINVLRAATPLVEGLLKAFPAARQGVVVARRREGTFNRSTGGIGVDIYYSKLPEIGPDDIVIIADPMLATGSTVMKVLELIQSRGNPKSIIVVSVMASRYGVDRVLKSKYDLNIYTVEIDEELNDMGYIVPGLGDAGDRAFG